LQRQRLLWVLQFAYDLGLNMPARTVLFSSIRRFDGREWVQVVSSEYMQMAGRAGRRGKDTTGTVILYFDRKKCLLKILAHTVYRDLPEEKEMREMMVGKGQELESKFKVTYKMILFILKSEHIKVTDIMRNSFIENSNEKDRCEQKEVILMKKMLLTSLKPIECIHGDPELMDNYVD
jgi:antiviral helicase SKI2